jgi:hypothetical protein
MEYMMKTNWNKKTLNEVREIAKKTSTNVKNFSDDDLKQFLNIFVKAKDKAEKENK